MGQINYIRGLIGETLSLEPNLGLIENIEILRDQI
jgi:hypothetical protein